MKNVCGNEKLVRVTLGTVLVVLCFIHIIHGALGVTVAIIGALLVLTGMFGFCPVNALFGLNSCKPKNKKTGPGISQMNQNPQAAPPVDVMKANNE